MARPGEFERLSRAEQERLFLDILEKPAGTGTGTWGAWFHAWLEEQCAEGRSLGEIAARIDLPSYADERCDGWTFLMRHVRWMVESGYARIVRIQVLA